MCSIPIKTSLTKLLCIFKFAPSYNIHKSWNKSYRQLFRNYSTVRDYNFNYFRNNQAYCESVIPIWKNEEFKKIWSSYSTVEAYNKKLSDLLTKDMKSDEWRSHLAIIANASLNKYIEPGNLENILKQCTNKIHEWPMDFSLLVLDAWFLALGNSVFNSSYFQTLLKLWNLNLKFSTKNQLIQMLYYIGLSKKTPELNMPILLQSLENHTNETSPVEWGIISLSFFRGSRKLNSPVLIAEMVLAAKMLMKTNETFHLISILKCLRLNRYFDRFLLRDLQAYVEQEIKNFNFVECTNFLAAFSSEAVYDEKLYSCLEYQAVEKLKNEFNKKNNAKLNDHPSVHSRAKDLARLLWALANVSHTLDRSTIDVILQEVQFKFSSNEYNDQVHILIDTLQSFAMMNTYPTDLLRYVFMDKNISQIFKKDRVKPRYQLYFLLQSAKIEHEQLMHAVDSSHVQKLKPLPKDLSEHIDSRLELAQLLEFLNAFKSENQTIDCYYLLPHIAIASICITTKAPNENIFSNVSLDAGSEAIECDQFHCIEVFDSSNCCRDWYKPSGLMKTKLRQLRKHKYAINIVKAAEVETLLDSPPSVQLEAASFLLRLPYHHDDDETWP